MIPQQKFSEAVYQQADPEYGRYEGNQTNVSRHHSETSYTQEVREGPDSKVYPPLRDKGNTLRFALVVIALGLLVLFGLLFVIGIGGTTGAGSFFVASLALIFITGIGITSIKTR